MQQPLEAILDRDFLDWTVALPTIDAEGEEPAARRLRQAFQALCADRASSTDDELQLEARETVCDYYRRRHVSLESADNVLLHRGSFPLLTALLETAVADFGAETIRFCSRYQPSATT